MNKLDKMILTTFLTVGVLASASLDMRAAESLVSSKDAVLKTVIATPGDSKVSGQSVDAAAYNSKAAQPGGLAATKAKSSNRPVDALAYSSKAR